LFALNVIICCNYLYGL